MKITEKIEKILIVDLAFIGDVILITPAVRALKKQYPNASLTMLTTPVVDEIAQLNPYIDDVLIYDKKGIHKGLKGMFCIAKRLRRENFTLAVCMNFALRGAVVTWLAGIKYRVGYDAQHASWFLTHVVSANRGVIQHEVLNHLCILKALDLQTENTALEFSIPVEVHLSMLQKINVKDQKFIAFCPFGRYEYRSFSVLKAQTVCKILQLQGAVYLIGGAKEHAALAEVAEMAGLPKDHVLAGNLSLQELAAFLAQAQVLLTVDTGPLHIAQAVNIPVVALFGPSNPAVWGPRGIHDILLYQKNDCSPCEGKGRCANHDCMDYFSDQEIAAAVLKLFHRSEEVVI